MNVEITTLPEEKYNLNAKDLTIGQGLVYPDEDCVVRLAESIYIIIVYRNIAMEVRNAPPYPLANGKLLPTGTKLTITLD